MLAAPGLAANRLNFVPFIAAEGRYIGARAESPVTHRLVGYSTILSSSLFGRWRQAEFRHPMRPQMLSVTRHVYFSRWIENNEKKPQ
jgi:hypothetical protein